MRCRVVPVAARAASLAPPAPPMPYPSAMSMTPGGEGGEARKGYWTASMSERGVSRDHRKNWALHRAALGDAEGRGEAACDELATGVDE